jgi:sec-independent protein translocase protein TatC
MARRRRKSVSSTSETMSLTDHLTELRQRLVKAILAIFVGALFVLLFYDPILNFLTKPFRDLCNAEKLAKTAAQCQLISTDPIAGLTTRMRISGWGGVVIALPIILWQIWRFVAPGMHSKEKKYAVPFVASSLLLFAAGAAIAYITLSEALKFLIGWSGENVSPLYTVDKYVRLVTLMMLAFGGGFLFPVLLVFLELVNVLTPRKLLGWWRQAVVLIIVFAAVITPSGDPFSLFALAIPMWIFYFMSAGIGALVLRRRKPAAS